MRAAVAAALAACFLLVAAGCGSSTAATGQTGGDAAQLVPPTALAFASADANLDSAQAFQAVRTASSGISLADKANYRSAKSQLGGSALATAYATGKGAQALPEKMRAFFRVGGSPQWVAARVTAEDNAVRLDARGSGATGPAPYEPTLLGDVPSGAILAVSFKNVDELLARLRAEPALRASLPPFAKKLNGLSGE